MPAIKCGTFWFRLRDDDPTLIQKLRSELGDIKQTSGPHKEFNYYELHFHFEVPDPADDDTEYRTFMEFENYLKSHVGDEAILSVLYWEARILRPATLIIPS